MSVTQIYCARRLAAGIVLVVALAVPAAAAQAADAASLIDRAAEALAQGGDGATQQAIDLLEEASGLGDPDADYLLATLVEADDPERAARLYQRGVDAGHLLSHNALGRLYLNGIGVKRDLAKAEALFTSAAEKGSLAAHNNLGYMFLHGIWVDRDLKKAARLLRKAADGGIMVAQHNLAWMYQRGLGVEKNIDTAMDWYAQAAKAGYGPSQLNLGLLLVDDADGQPRDVPEGVKWLMIASFAEDATLTDRAEAVIIELAKNGYASEVQSGLQQARVWVDRRLARGEESAAGGG